MTGLSFLPIALLVSPIKDCLNFIAKRNGKDDCKQFLNTGVI